MLFPDTTALINFATIERMDLLEKIAAERAWCGSVSDECSAWAGEPDLSSIRRAWDIFGEPLRPDTPVEHLTTRTYYERLRVPGEPRTKNLGEAETLSNAAASLQFCVPTITQSTTWSPEWVPAIRK